MASIEIPPVGTAVTANCTDKGVITIASTANWYPGQIAMLSNNAPSSQRIKILEILTGTTMRAKALPLVDNVAAISGQPNTLNYYAGSDLSAFTLATSSRVDAPRQTVRVEQPTFAKLPSVP